MQNLITKEIKMKKGLVVLSVIASTMLMASYPIGDAGYKLDGSHEETQSTSTVKVGETFGEALKKGKFTAALRTFYFDRSFDEDKTGNADARALTFGGIIKYESAAYYGFKFGLAHYSSTRLGNIFTREEGKGTSMLGREGQNLAFLGEAYVQYDIGNTMLKVGRQQLATPLIQNHDLRILPSVYEAAILRNKDIPDTMIEIGFVDRYTGFTSKENAFLDTKTGKDGLAYISASNTSIENLILHAQYIDALTDTNTRQSYTYADAKYNLPFGTNTYIKGQFGMNEYLEGKDSTLVGAKIGTTIGMFSIAALYDKISDNAFQAFESGPMYSDWQQGYGPYEASTAFGGQLVIKPMAGLSVKFGYVDVQSDTDKLVDDFTEFNLDAKYTINDWSKIRVRYSIKDQSNASEALRYDGIDDNGGREDRDDFRVQYYVNF